MKGKFKKIDMMSIWKWNHIRPFIVHICMLSDLDHLSKDRVTGKFGLTWKLKI